jgi:hypothetical protein
MRYSCARSLVRAWKTDYCGRGTNGLEPGRSIRQRVRPANQMRELASRGSPPPKSIPATHTKHADPTHRIADHLYSTPHENTKRGFKKKNTKRTRPMLRAQPLDASPRPRSKTAAAACATPACRRRLRNPSLPPPPPTQPQLAYAGRLHHPSLDTHLRRFLPIPFPLQRPFLAPLVANPRSSEMDRLWVSLAGPRSSCGRRYSSTAYRSSPTAALPPPRRSSLSPTLSYSPTQP